MTRDGGGGWPCRVEYWRAHLQAEGFQPCSFGCRLGSQFRLEPRFQPPPPPQYSVRRVFPGTASSNRHLPVWSGVFRGNTGVKTDPAILLGGSSVYSVLRLHHVQGGFPRLCVRAARHGVATCAQRSSLRVGCVVPPFNAWRPHPPVWRSPSHFPAPRL